MPNYTLNCWVGNDEPGIILRDYELSGNGHDVGEMERRGQITPTELPATRPARVPVKVDDSAAAVLQERDGLVKKVKELRDDNTRLAGVAKELEGTKKTLSGELAKYADENGKLKAAVKSLTAERDEARKHLDELTAPAEKPKK